MGFEVTLYPIEPGVGTFDGEAWDCVDHEGRAVAQLKAGAPFRCALDRRAEWVMWVLSRFDAQLGQLAIEGGDPIAPEAQSPQGFPIRWNPPDAVARIAAFLDGLTSETVADAVEPQAMAAAGLYKFFADRHIRSELAAAIAADFSNLRAFYRHAAADGVAAVVYKD